MGFLPRRRTKENLNQVDVFYTDVNNDIFVVQDVPDTFVQGRSAFKIFGSDFLLENVPLKIEILDKAGNTVFSQPIIYGENSPSLPYRYISVEVYPPPINTPGEAELIILGQINTDNPVSQALIGELPPRYQNAYNVRYRKIINIDTEKVINEQPILFYKKPDVTATEFVIAQKLFTPPTQRVISGSKIDGTVNKDIEGNQFISGSSVNTQISVNDKSQSPYGDLKAQGNLYKYKTGLYKHNKVLKRRGLKSRKSSPEKPQMTIRSATSNKFVSEMVGADIEVKNISLPTESVVRLSGLDPKVVNIDDIYNAFTFPNFVGKVESVDSDKEITLNKPYAVEFLDPTSTSTEPKKIFTSIGDNANDLFANFTSSYTEYDTPITSSYRFDSFVDFTISDMRTFSGDVYRIKVSGGSDSMLGEFPVLLDTVVDAPELLIDSTSPSGVLRTGYFLDQTHLDKYWNAFGGDNNTNTLVPQYTMSLADGIFLSGSYTQHNQVGRFELDNTYSFTVRKDVAYTLSLNAQGKKSTKTNIEGENNQKAIIFFHLSGSDLKDFNESDIEFSSSFGDVIRNEFGQSVGLEIPDSNLSEGYTDFGTVSHTFTPNFKPDRVKNTDTTLQIRINSGEWLLSDISLTPASSTGFSPDEFSFRVPISPNTLRPDNFDFLVEYLDINGNTAETVTFIDNVHISGSAFILEGEDNLLTGSMFMGNVAGAGIEMAGANSAYIKSVGYDSFISASAGKGGGFFIWSGSVLPNAPDNYRGAGLEIHDGRAGDNDSFLKFRTIDADNDNSSSLEIKTSRFFLGSESDGNFVSGALGNVEISSSNFHLTPEGNVTMSGTITADSGEIGGFTIDDGDLTSGVGNGAITMSSADKIISIGSGSTFNKGDLQGGFRVGIDTDGVFKFAVGTADSFIHADASGVSIKSDSFVVTASVAEIDVDVYKLSANNLFISSSGGGFISAGNPRPTGIDGTNKGIFIQGDTGVFLAGNAAGGHLKFDGTNTSISSSAFYLGNDSQFVSGALGNIEISSSNFHLTADGNVTMSGIINAQKGGNIGGFEIDATQINDTNDRLILKSDGQITASFIQLTGEVNITGGSAKRQLDTLGEETASLKAVTASLTTFVSVLGEKTASLAGSVTVLGEKTASLAGSVTVLGEKTASLQTGVDTLGEKTASLAGSVTSLGEKTASLATGITAVGTSAVSSASLFAINTKESASLFSISSVASSSAISAGSVSSASLQVTSSKLILENVISEVSSSVTSSKLDLEISLAGVSSSVSGAFTEVSTSIATTNTEVSTSIAARQQTDKLETKAKEATFSSSFILIGEQTASLQTATASLATGITSVGASSITSASLFVIATELSSSVGLAQVSSSVSGAFTETSQSIATTNTEVSTSIAARQQTDTAEVKATLSEVSSSVTSSKLDLEISLAGVSSSVSGAFTETSQSIATTNTEVSTSIAARQQVDILANRAAEATFSSSFILVGEMTSSLTEATASAESSLASIGVSTASIATTTASIEVDSGSIAAAVQLTSASLNILNSSSDKIAEFGANTFVGLQNSEHVQISPSGLDLKDGSTLLGRFASTTTIGSTTTEHVQISGSGLELLDGSTQRFAINSSGVAVGDNFNVDASGNVSMSGVIVAPAGNIGTFIITSGSIDSDTSNSKRGLKLEPGKSIRGYGSTVHSTTTVAGKFSFGVGVISPAANSDAPFAQDQASAPGALSTN